MTIKFLQFHWKKWKLLCFASSQQSALCNFSLDANMFLSVTKLTKHESCESYLCDVASINQLQPPGTGKLIKTSKSVTDHNIGNWLNLPVYVCVPAVTLSEPVEASLPTSQTWVGIIFRWLAHPLPGTWQRRPVCTYAHRVQSLLFAHCTYHLVVMGNENAK